MTQNEGCQEQENQRENNSTLQREAVCAQHAKEVSRRISVYHLCFCNVSVDVFHSPAANLTIVTKDDEACQNADTACKAPFLADGAEGTECIFVCVTTYRKFCHHNCGTDQSNHDDVNQQESTAAAIIRFAGELPDVTQTYSRTCCGQDKA